MDYTTILSQVLIIVSVLTIFVNIITEVAKNAIPQLSGSSSINLFVLGLSEVVTIISFIAYFQIIGMALTWYLTVAFIVVGILVAYSAMFGYDKLLSYFSGLTGGE